jgi:hypothetical protein
MRDPRLPRLRQLANNLLWSNARDRDWGSWVFRQQCTSDLSDLALTFDTVLIVVLLLSLVTALPLL